MGLETRRAYRASLAFLLSAISVVGGHIYNRRLERAWLVTAIAIAVMVLYWFVGPALIIGNATDAELAQRFDLFNQVYRWLFVGIPLLSAAIAAGDAMRATPHQLAALSPGTRTAGVLLSVALAIPVLQFALVTLWSNGPVLRSTTSVTSTEFREGAATVIENEPSFFGSVHFGGGFDPRHGVEPLPSGDGVLQGHIVHGGKPVTGARVEILIGNRYEAKQVTADDGSFEFRLRPGKWLLNHVQIHEWPDAPVSGRFVLRAGLERSLEDSDYRGPFTLTSRGLPITVQPQGSSDLQLNAVKPVALIWPAPAADPSRASLEDATLQWRPYPDARDYVIEISRIERKTADSWTSSTVRQVRVQQPQLRLAELESVSLPGKTTTYGVKLYAFAANRSYLSESLETLQRHEFELVGAELQEVADTDDESFAASFGERYRDRARIEAAATLIDDGELDAAESLLARVKPEENDAELLALQGYLAAARGDCATASSHFERASSLDPACVPRRYWVRCQEE